MSAPIRDAQLHLQLSGLAGAPVRPVPRQEVRLQVDPPRVQRAAAVVEHDDGLAVAKRGEVPRMEQRLAALAERLARPDAAGAAPGRAGGEPLPGPRRRRRRSVLRSGRCMGTAVVFAERGAVVYKGGVASWWSGLSRTSMKPVVYGGCGCAAMRMCASGCSSRRPAATSGYYCAA